MSAKKLSEFPYQSALAHQRWDQGVEAQLENLPQDLPSARFLFDRHSNLASAGSCFARHLAALLKQENFNYLVYEHAPPFLSRAQQEQASRYSATYGEIYSSRQLLQLFQAATGQRSYSEPPWKHNNHWIDPFRPREHLFSSEAEVQLAKKAHLFQVKKLFLEADIFIFTLGLTEIWQNCAGDVLPVCPGGRFGVFAEEQYHFHNLSLADNLAAMRCFCTALKQLNPKIRLILTLSPVPLSITHEPTHVLLASEISKARLRLCIQELLNEFDWLDYFPAYEWVKLQPERYFNNNQRQINPLSIRPILQRFIGQFCPTESLSAEAPDSDQPPNPDQVLLPELCDPEVLLNSLDSEFLD